MDERRSPKVLSLAWGEIEIEGVGEVKDAVLYPGGGGEWDWRVTGTRHSPASSPPTSSRCSRRALLRWCCHWASNWCWR
ncbi:hypothetical protein ACFQZ4_10410 [Catellatospora coxensis]